jgi:hypothetical protein
MSSRLRAAIFGFGIVAVFAAGLARSAQAQETEEPEALIKQGISLRRKGDDRRAQGYLKRAYDLAKTPRSAAQLGLVEQALGQFADSQIHLSEALATKDAWVQENRAQLEESRNFVRSKLAKVAITGAPGDATIAVGSDPPFALPRDGVVWLAPGANTVVVAAPGRKPVTKTVTAGPGESTSVAVELPADAPPTPPAAAASAGIGAAPGGPTPAPVEVIQVPAPAETGQSSTGRTLRITGIGVAAAGVALAVTGFVLRGIASSKLDAIQSDAAALRPYNESNDNWQTFEHAGVALLVTGGAAAVAGALLYVLNLPSSGEGHDAKVSLVVLPRETGASLQLGARF